jgi:hypothetical protein
VNDPATTSNAFVEAEFAGTIYKIYPLDWNDHGELQRWLDSHIRNPMDLVRSEIARGGLPTEIMKYMVESGLKVWSNSRIILGSIEAKQLLESNEGWVFQFYLSVKKGDRDFTFEKAREVARKIDETAREIARQKVLEAANAMGTDARPKVHTPNGSMITPTVASPLSTGGDGNIS